MANHPSLSAPYIAPPPLRAVGRMASDEGCWCRSGEPWGTCHRGRSTKSPINIYKIEELSRRKFEAGYCSHDGDEDDPCSLNIVSAHTIQRRGGLAAIAEQAGHVLTVKPTMKRMFQYEGNPPPSKVGVRRASAFPGFCGHHDDRLFKTIEGDNVAMNAPEAMLFAYRAIAYERYAKKAMLASVAVHRQMDRGQPLETQQEMQQHLVLVESGARRGLAETEAVLADYQRRIGGSDLQGFHYRAFRFDRHLPIVTCGAFMPEFGLDGTPLQRLARGDAPLEQLTLSITTFGNGSVVFFGWTGEVDGPAADYVRSFEAIGDHHKPDALIRLAFEQLENIFLRISWWNNLEDHDRAALTRSIQSGTGSVAHQALGYWPRTPPLTIAELVETRHS